MGTNTEFKPLKDVNMTHDECGSLFGAGKTLLENSGLVSYCGHSFVCKSHEDDIEEYWEENFDPKFGRYMAWVWFSVGAENLVKAALVCNGLVKGKPQKLGYPVYSRETEKRSWIDMVLQCKPPKGDYGSEEAQKYEFRTLDHIWKVKLNKLSEKCGIPETEKKELKAAFKYLANPIRNRDAHTYIRDQRRRDFPAVEGIFVPAFNTLLRTMKDKGHFTPGGNA